PKSSSLAEVQERQVRLDAQEHLPDGLVARAAHEAVLADDAHVAEEALERGSDADRARAPQLENEIGHLGAPLNPVRAGQEQAGALLDVERLAGPRAGPGLVHCLEQEGPRGAQQALRAAHLLLNGAPVSEGDRGPERRARAGELAYGLDGVARDGEP